MYKCKICGSKIEKIINSNRNESYYVCELCDFISKDRNKIVSEVEELRHYSLHNNSIDDPRYVEYFSMFLKKAVFPFAKKEKYGFDFGSGPSPVLAQILERNFNYEMDIYDYYFSPKNVYEGKKYDLITSTEVFEHLENPLEYFEKLKDLMKKDGILALMTQFHPKDEDKFVEWYYIRDVTHISFYTIKTMEYIALKVGLKIIYTDEQKMVTFAVNK